MSYVNLPFLSSFMPRDTANTGFADSSRRPPVLDILLVRNGSKMTWIDASGVMARVIDVHSLGDRLPRSFFVGKAVRWFANSFPINNYPQLAVAKRKAASPNVAVARAVNIELEPFFFGHEFCVDAKRLQCLAFGLLVQVSGA